MTGPTPRQIIVLRVLSAAIERTGLAPSIDELGELLGISRRGAHDHLAKLKLKGLVADHGHTCRTWQITEYGMSFLSRSAVRVFDATGKPSGFLDVGRRCGVLGCAAHIFGGTRQCGAHAEAA